MQPKSPFAGGKQQQKLADRTCVLTCARRTEGYARI